MAPERILVLKSGRCSWGKCVFCGYGRIAGRVARAEELKKQFDAFFSEVSEGDTIKVFGSGSFLDPKQVPEEARRYFIDRCKEKKTGRLCVESRPEHVSDAALLELAGMDASIGIGLESANDRTLEKIQKGFKRKDYEDAAKKIHAHGLKVRTYLIANLPFTEDPKKDLDESVEYALKHSDSIVIINLLPHGNTPVFKMWVRGEWNYLSKKEFYDFVSNWKDNPKIELDAETFRFTPKFPEEAQEKLSGVGEEYLTHPHFEVWQDYLIRWYRPPEKKDVLLFLPCTHRKPYSLSKTHIAIREVLARTGARERTHEVMLSNAGVIPREFENHYPFNAYDWDESLETDAVKQRYVEVTYARIKRYLETHGKGYHKVLCFLKYSSESYVALEKACQELGIELENLLCRETYERIKNDKRPLQSSEALTDLEENISRK